MENKLPIRKKIRLTGYDYSQEGYYHITICVKNGHEMLAQIIVGDAAHGVPCVELTDIGRVVEHYIENINIVYGDEVKLDKYVIMPNHIHMIIVLNNSGTPWAASPTKAKIPKVINSLKTLVTKKIGFSIWHRSYNDRIVRSEQAYRNIWQYIEENPMKWQVDKYYTKQEEIIYGE
ncbi:MAG: transposase [Oscillospiraceae bacterium]|nr:transposase [Oscillospiraceae bacterium]